MQVIDHAPQSWFLLEDSEAAAGDASASDAPWVFDANCNHSFFGYSFTMVLTAEERADYRQHGRAALDRLAEAIQHSAPVLAASRSIYKGREVDAACAQRVQQAVAAWQARTPPT